MLMMNVYGGWNHSRCKPVSRQQDHDGRTEQEDMKIRWVLMLILVVAWNGSEVTDDPVSKRILIFGDSIAAGYGLDPELAFPARIQQKIDQMGWGHHVVNAGVSGETSAGGVRRVGWVLQQRVDLFVLELGGNDALRGVDPMDTRENLQQILDRVVERWPEAVRVLAGMEAPPSMGEAYVQQFREIYRELDQRNDLVFIPFILDGVAGEPALNLEDGIHPTAEGHERIAEIVWEVLEPLLRP